MAILKAVKPEAMIYQKVLLIIIMSSSRERVFMANIDCDIKRSEEIKKLTTGHREDYTTGCLLDYDNIKNHYRLIAVDLCSQKDLGAHPKTI